MIQVAIVEDDADDARTERNFIEKYAASSKEEIRISEFRNGSGIVDHYQACYDIIFLDVEMSGMNGIETAREIRSVDRDVIIVFITNVARYAIKGYEVQALDYILKPLRYEAFAQKLRHIARLVEAKGTDQSIVIRSDNTLQRLLVSDIQYVEVTAHTLIYHTENGSLSARGALKEVEAKLPQAQFCRCNKCFLVNLRHVRTIKDGMVLVGKDYLPISRSLRKTFVTEVVNYLGSA